MFNGIQLNELRDLSREAREEARGLINVGDTLTRQQETHIILLIEKAITSNNVMIVEALEKAGIRL